MLLGCDDGLGRHCHLLSAQVTRKQFGLSLCSADRLLSGLAFPNMIVCRQSRFCRDLFVVGRRARRQTEGPVFNCLLPVSNLSGTSLGRQKKRRSWVSVALAPHSRAVHLRADSRAPRSDKQQRLQQQPPKRQQLIWLKSVKLSARLEKKGLVSIPAVALKSPNQRGRLHSDTDGSQK